MASKRIGNWLRASEAAAVIGNVTRRTVSAWVANGTIPDAALLRCGSQHRVARWWCEAMNTAPAHPLPARTLAIG